MLLQFSTLAGSNSLYVRTVRTLAIRFRFQHGHVMLDRYLYTTMLTLSHAAAVAFTVGDPRVAFRCLCPADSYNIQG